MMQLRMRSMVVEFVSWLLNGCASIPWCVIWALKLDTRYFRFFLELRQWLRFDKRKFSCPNLVAIISNGNLSDSYLSYTK